MTMAAKASERFTAEERAAMKEAARERKSGSGEADVLEKIAEMSDSDRALAERIHAIVKETAPDLSAKTWYGMPAYAAGDKVVLHFQPAEKFKSRYATLGFSDKAQLDDGSMWPIGFALAELTPDVEAKIASLVAQAASD
jgi:uncharacterized protein YdhG (YjbR/CyaY superfamily)